MAKITLKLEGSYTKQNIRKKKRERRYSLFASVFLSYVAYL